MPKMCRKWKTISTRSRLNLLKSVKTSWSWLRSIWFPTLRLTKLKFSSTKWKPTTSATRLNSQWTPRSRKQHRKRYRRMQMQQFWRKVLLATLIRLSLGSHSTTRSSITRSCKTQRKPALWLGQRLTRLFKTSTTFRMSFTRMQL